MPGKSLLVIATPQGQLGNTLVHFAHIRAFAIEHGIPLVHCACDRYANYFAGSHKDLFCYYSPDPKNFFREPLVLNVVAVFKTFLSVIQKERELLPESSVQWILGAAPEVIGSVTSDEMRHMLFLFGCAFVEWVYGGMFKQIPVELVRVRDDENTILSEDPRIQGLLRQEKIILLDGWNFRDPKSFQKHADALRAYFKPLPQYEQTIAANISAIRAQCDVLVGVHIRWGDYKEFLDGIHYFTAEEYVKRMREARDCFPGKKVGFLICSNEKQDPANFSEFIHAFGPGSALEDMYALAKCDCLIGPPSTFTSWASFHGGARYYQMDRSGRKISFE